VEKVRFFKIDVLQSMFCTVVPSAYALVGRRQLNIVSVSLVITTNNGEFSILRMGGI